MLGEAKAKEKLWQQQSSAGDELEKTWKIAFFFFFFKVRLCSKEVAECCLKDKTNDLLHIHNTRHHLSLIHFCARHGLVPPHWLHKSKLTRLTRAVHFFLGQPEPGGLGMSAHWVVRRRSFCASDIHSVLCQGLPLQLLLPSCTHCTHWHLLWDTSMAVFS